MIIRTLEECERSERCVKAPTWQSVRMLLADDEMGFSFHITTIYANTQTPIHYTNHLESVYCIAGNGSIIDLTSGASHQIKPGTLYALDKNDRHELRGGSQDMILACVFNPAITGREVHDEHGAYPLPSA
jgi:L-ectoine synthase